MVDLNTVQLESSIPTNSKITIYHSTTEVVNGRPRESFQHFVLDVWLETSRGEVVKKYSNQSDIEALVLIPLKEKYLSSKKFNGEVGFWTIEAGDRVVIGEEVREISRASDLTDDDSIETLLVSDVEEFLIPRGLHHMEVGLK